MLDRFAVDTRNLLAFFPEGDRLTSQFNGPQSGLGVVFLCVLDDLHQLVDQELSLNFTHLSALGLTFLDLFNDQRMVHQLGRKLRDRRV